jgi:vacuolar protein sorting-associated protein VTA1
MKEDIGSIDVVTDEAASSAYVENFALKVFAVADNEDRREGWTK